MSIKRITAVVTGFLATLLVVGVVGASVSDDDGIADGLDRSPRPSTTTVTITVPEPATVTVMEPPPPPSIAFSDGIYLVGVDVEPGDYRSDGPTSTHCYWARLSDSSGADIIANSITQGPSRVTIVAGEYLEVSGCSFYRA